MDEILEQVLSRIEEVRNALDGEEEFLRDEYGNADPDEWQEADKEANKLDARLSELFWMRNQLNKINGGNK
jgi:hypothetical protein